MKVAPREEQTNEARASGNANARQEIPWRALALPIGVFLLALLVRVVGLTWGLPNAERWYSYHPDESVNQIVGAVARLSETGFNPQFFNYPSLSIYATWLFYQLLAGFGLTTNANSLEFPWPFVRDIIFAGRIFSALCGAGTAVVAYFIAREFGLKRGAIVAGILTALAPGFVQHSHFATVDVPSTFFVSLCLLLTLRAQNFKGLAWAAFVAGIAAGAKYNAGLVVVAPIVAGPLPCLERHGNGPAATRAVARNETENQVAPSARTGGEARCRVFQGTAQSVAFVALSLVGFLITTPYALLDFETFWGNPATQQGFAYEAFHHPREGSGDIFRETGNGWWYHFSFNLPFVMTWPLIIGALVGIGFAARNRKWWPLLAFAGLFFVSLGFSQVRFMRYLLPLVPVLCVTAAWGAANLPKPKIWAGILVGFALVGTFDVLAPLVYGSAQTRDRAVNSLRNRGLVGLINNPWFYTPPFQPRGFNQPVEGAVATGFDVQKLETAPPDVFAVSEFEVRENLRLNPDGEAAQFLQELNQRYQKQFVYEGPGSGLLPGREFAPHDYLYTHPKVTVYSFPTR